jgi:hypothetical protein
LAKAGSKTYTLSVTNPAGDSVTAKVTLSVAGFVTTGSMTTTRTYHAATRLVDGQVLVTAGYDDLDRVYSSTADLYDPQSGKFITPALSMIKARAWHTATLLTDGRVLVAGGNVLDNGLLANAELYAPSTKQFTTSASVMSVPF